MINAGHCLLLDGKSMEKVKEYKKMENQFCNLLQSKEKIMGSGLFRG
jgi:hypothetical protein